MFICAHGHVRNDLIVKYEIKSYIVGCIMSRLHGQYNHLIFSSADVIITYSNP